MQKELRGQPFIAEIYTGGNFNCRRICENCFYNNEEEIPTENLCTTTSLTKKLGLNEVPLELDGKPVGNYCPDFLIYSAD